VSGAKTAQQYSAGLDWMIGGEPLKRLGIFFFTTTSRPALRTTQPSIQWVPGALSQWVKQPVSEADHSPLSSAKVKKCMELYHHSPYMP